MTIRPHNFGAGPAILPMPVMERAREEFLAARGTGLSAMEWSHRTPFYEELHAGIEASFRRLLDLEGDEGYRILFLQGGASLQFAQVPMNLASPSTGGDYVITGTWAKKAFQEAARIGRPRAIWDGEEQGFTTLPDARSLEVSPEAAYLHLATNNTIFGTEFHELPEPPPGVPLVGDMSSNILSEPLDVRRFGLIYAGAQKNLGPAGLGVVIIRSDLLERAPKNIPNILSYRAHVAAQGLYHTPPTFAVYMMGMVLEWIEAEGGLEVMARRKAEKSGMLYAAIDTSDGFYRGTADPACRSGMNVTFRLKDTSLEERFFAEAAAAGLAGIRGHRSVGGARASLYNPLPIESVAALVAFMSDFRKRNG